MMAASRCGTFTLVVVVAAEKADLDPEFFHKGCELLEDADDELCRVVVLGVRQVTQDHHCLNVAAFALDCEFFEQLPPVAVLRVVGQV